MSWKVIKELKENRAKAFADAQAIRDNANKETRDLNADEETRHAALLGDVATFAKRIDREEQANIIGESMTEAREKVSQIGREEVKVGANSLGIAERDFSKYSICRAIAKRLDNQPLDGIEGEVSQELALRSGKAPNGFYYPTEARTLLNLTTGTGAVPTILSASFIEILRNKMVLSGLGVTFMPGMTGAFAIPKQTAAGTAYWVAEGSAPTTSNQTVGQTAFSAKTVGAFTDISRKFIKQANFSADQFVQNDLAAVLGIEIERAALFGSGTSNQPLGIIPNIQANYTGQIVSMGTNGAAIDYPSAVKLETLVAAANADFGTLGYLGNAKVRGALKTTVKSGTAATVGFVWDANEVNGYKATVSNTVPSNGTKGSGTNLSTFIFGNWSSLVIAMWGGLDVLVDPYTGGNAGTVRINVLQDVDINCRYPEGAFSVIVDAIA